MTKLNRVSVLAGTILVAMAPIAYGAPQTIAIEPSTAIPAIQAGTRTAPRLPKNGEEVKIMSGADLKAAIAYAAETGDLSQQDANELIDKINDMEMLVNQYDFIRDQQKRMIGSVRSSFH